MRFESPLISGRLIKRYQRFLADVELPDGQIITAHCPNSGSMKGCNIPGSPVLLSAQNKPGRKYPYTWEMIFVNDTWAGINTAHPNLLVSEAIANGEIPELSGYPLLQREARYGRENSRIDILLSNNEKCCYVEVKNVTLVEGNRALFPDAVTERGQKHLRELMEMVAEGHRGIIFFLVQRGDALSVSPADTIDPTYGQLLRTAVASGVEALAYRALVTPEEIGLSQKLPIIL
jgi:sugar fermentation stimulation protein A